MKYEEPIIEALYFEKKNVITTSGELEVEDDYTGEDDFGPRT